MNQKTNYAEPALCGREGVFTRRPSYHIHNRHNSRMYWYSNRKLAETTSHCLHEETTPEKEQETTFLQDQDYRSDHQNHTNPLPQPTTNTKKLSVTTQTDNNENAPNDNLPSQTTEEDTHKTIKIPTFHNDFATALNSIKEYITERNGDTYIPLHSTIVLKNRRRMLYLPLEFGELTMDGLVDSGAFINVMS